jgi:hypothetical protein
MPLLMPTLPLHLGSQRWPLIAIRYIVILLWVRMARPALVVGRAALGISQHSTLSTADLRTSL